MIGLEKIVVLQELKQEGLAVGMIAIWTGHSPEQLGGQHTHRRCAECRSFRRRGKRLQTNQQQPIQTYQLPTVNSVTIPYARMVRFFCICGVQVVHATQNPRIPRSGFRFDLRNPAFRPQTRRPSDLAELFTAREQATKRRNAELSLSN